MALKNELDGLTPDQRAYVKKAIAKTRQRALRNAPDYRGTVLSLKFKQVDVETWREAARAAGETLTDWIEKMLNRAAKKRGE